MPMELKVFTFNFSARAASISLIYLNRGIKKVQKFKLALIKIMRYIICLFELKITNKNDNAWTPARAIHAYERAISATSSCSRYG